MKNIAFLIAFYIFSYYAYANYSGGNGTYNDPYLISNINDIIYLGQSPGHWDLRFKLTADIDMAEDVDRQFCMLGRDILSYPTDIQIDSDEKKMYWIDSDRYCIYRANTDGSGMETVIPEGISRPSAIALDTLNRKLYWGNRTGLGIQRANLDGSEILMLVTAGVSDPFGMEVDATRGKIYWTEYFNGQIKSINLDGTNQTVFKSGLGGPHGIAVDETNGYIYCSEYFSKRIIRYDLNGGSFKVVASNTNGVRGIVLDETTNTIYWAQYQGVYRANTNGSGLTKIASSTQYENGIALEFPGITCILDIGCF